MQLFRAGQALYDAGEFVRAAESFAEAYRLSRRLPLLFNVYVAWRDAGRLERAAEALRRYLQEAPEGVEGRTPLEARLRRLDARVAALERERAARQRLEAARREEAARRARAREAERRAAAEAARARTPWYVAGGGVGLTLLGAGAGLLALSARADLEAGCGGEGCPYRPIYSDYESDVARARTWALVADVTMATGAVVALGGLLWALVRPGTPSESQASPERGRLRLVAGSSGSVLHWGVTW